MMAKTWRWIKIGLLLAGIILIAFSDFQSRAKKLRITPTQAELIRAPGCIPQG